MGGAFGSFFLKRGCGSLIKCFKWWWVIIWIYYLGNDLHSLFSWTFHSLTFPSKKGVLPRKARIGTTFFILHTFSPFPIPSP